LLANIEKEVGVPFIDTWNYIQNNLHVGDDTKNWTKNKQYLGDEFTISSLTPTQIDVKTPGAINIQKIPRIDFEDVYAIWQKYIGGTYTREQIRDKTRYSKYIISILNWVENVNGGTLP